MASVEESEGYTQAALDHANSTIILRKDGDATKLHERYKVITTRVKVEKCDCCAQKKCAVDGCGSLVPAETGSAFISPSGSETSDVFGVSQLLGLGGQGEVILGVCKKSGHSAVVKRVKLLSGAQRVDAARELEILQKVMSEPGGSDYILKLEGMYVTKMDGELVTEICMIFEYMPGGDLESYRRKKGALVKEQLQRIAYDVLSALKIIHSNGFVSASFAAANTMHVTSFSPCRFDVNV